jgi:two-component sensor histidine kinase
MKIEYRKIKYIEITLITIVWLVLLVTPILFREDIYRPIKDTVIIQLEIITPLLLLFVLNHFIFVPKLLFRGRPLFFIISVMGIIILFTLGAFVYDTKMKSSPPPNLSLREKQIMLPPYSLPGGVDPFGNLRPELPRQARPIPPFANFLILSVLIVGFDTGLRSGLRWIITENDKVRLEKENVDTQLILLRNQISPHFFMNTLNNIHSLVDVNTDEAKEAIIKLSRMMRYLLYETETERTTIKKEVDFLESYINLMKLRFSEKVKIVLNLPTVIPEKTIPPFLFISLIENAFKHGISYREESFINIDLVVGEERLLLIVKNSKTDNSQINEYSGIGIENTRKRLALIYGSNYHLDIIDNENLFTVNLSIPL